VATAQDVDPEQRQVLTDLFTEIAILEHVVRNRFEPDYRGRYTAAEFGLLNFFGRMGRTEDRLSHIAFCFEVSVDEARVPVEALVARGLFTIDVSNDPCVRITEAGREAHTALLDSLAPEVLEIVDGIDPEHLRITAETLKEIRRTADNLPRR
jgi:DNA-binding MarR family transcriptional regulator